MLYHVKSCYITLHYIRLYYYIMPKGLDAHEAVALLEDDRAAAVAELLDGLEAAHLVVRIMMIIIIIVVLNKINNNDSNNDNHDNDSNNNNNNDNNRASWLSTRPRSCMRSAAVLTGAATSCRRSPVRTRREYLNVLCSLS